MRNLIEQIEQTRKSLEPFIGKTSNSNFAQINLPENFHEKSRFVRKVPKENYEGLGRAVPISWL